MEFTYTVINAEGKREKGSAHAPDKFALAHTLKGEGKLLVSAEEKKGGVFAQLNSISLFSHIKSEEKIMFAHNLAAMTRAGLSLSRALSIMGRQSKNVKFKSIMGSLAQTITEGGTFSDALKKHPKEFSALFISMVHAGEESGSLPEALEVVGNQMKKNDAIVKKVKGAMIYPSIIISVMVVVGIVMIVKVVPTLTSTFTELNVELPATTQFLIALSDAIRLHGLLLSLGVALVVMGTVFAARTKQGRYTLHTIILRIPVIGNVIKELNAARTARTFSSLLSAGVDIVEALEITHDVLQNVRYKEVINTAATRIQKGVQLSAILEEEGAVEFYPVLFSEMVAVGEETGKLTDMLEETALFYEGEVEGVTKNLTTIVEPFLMLIVGVAVGFFALAMIAPMYSVMNGV
jgi:type IV pilus assembly protein PilC